MRYLSAVAIFRNENPYLEEWLHYHRHLGVEHFYLYNNDEDTTQSDRILRPYIESGLVDNIPYQGESMQMPAYRDAAERTAGKTRWLAFIDLDEFILPREKDNLCEVMQDYEPFGGLGIYWHIFGSAGYIDPPPNQINYFLYRAAEHFPNNCFFKSIVCPEWVIPEKVVRNPHCFELKHGFIVNEHQHPISPTEHCSSKIRINHYAVRSYNYFFQVKSVRGLAIPAAPRNHQYWDWVNRNEVFDDEISRRFGHIVR